MMKTKQHRKARRGSNAVEFALILPVLVAFLAGIIDYGWFFNQQIMMVAAVRECARVGSLQADATAAQSTGLAVAVQVLTDANYSGTVTNNITTTTMDNGDTALVCDLEQTYTPLMGLLPDAAYPDNLHAIVTMRLENQ